MQRQQQNGMDQPVQIFAQALLLLVITTLAGPLFGLGISAWMAKDLGEAMTLTIRTTGAILVVGVPATVTWYFIASGAARKLFEGLGGQVEAEPIRPNREQTGDYENRPAREPTRVVPLYLQGKPPVERERWEPSGEDLAEWIKGWGAKGGYQQWRWNGYMLESGVAINPRNWQKLCAPLRQAGLLTDVAERETGTLQLNPAKVLEALGLS